MSVERRHAGHDQRRRCHHYKKSHRFELSCHPLASSSLLCYFIISAFAFHLDVRRVSSATFSKLLRAPFDTMRSCALPPEIKVERMELSAACWSGIQCRALKETTKSNSSLKGR